jgi:hypothetical protein
MGCAEGRKIAANARTRKSEFTMFVNNAVGNRWLACASLLRFAAAIAVYAFFFARKLIFCKLTIRLALAAPDRGA